MAELPESLAALLQPAAYPHEVGDISLIETHIAWVLLTGEFAYKIKRPVQLPFLDLRSAERRRFYCEEELRLNRRFAPDLYLDTCDVTEENGRARIGGSGRVLERCVKMRQFDRTNELDRLLARGAIEASTLESFGRELADIHEKLPVASDSDTWGSPAQVRKVLLENVQQYAGAARKAGFEAAVDIAAQMEQALAKLTGALEARLANGRVRECHGDLHSRNIVQIDQRLVGFDCLEFEPAFRWIDVAEEVALLVADLRAHGHTHEAHAFRSGYLARSGDYGLLRVLELYIAHRALTRAKVAALETQRGDFAALTDEARKALRQRKPVLILMAGVSGSGKTWLARTIAPDMDAVHLRSDVERKRFAGLDELASSGSATGTGLYANTMTDRVYQRLATGAADALAGGYSTIVDATFLMRSQRELFSALASEMAVPLKMILCDAPHDLLRERIVRRHTAGTDASEADLAVLDWQLAHREPIDSAEHLHVVKVSTTASDPLAQALRTLAP